MVDMSETRRHEALEQSMQDLATIGEATGVTFLFENVPPNFLAGNDPARLAAMIRTLDHPRVRMCFDTGHAHISGDAATALGQCLDVIAYLHVSDNDSLRDAHQIPGQGSCPFEAMRPHMAKLGEEVSTMLELFESPESMEAQLANGLSGKLAHWLATGG